MNRRSLLRLIGLAPVAAPMAAAAANAAPQGLGSRLMVIDPWSTMVGSALEPEAAVLDQLRFNIADPDHAYEDFLKAFAPRDLSTVTFGGLHPDEALDPEPSYLDLYPDELQPGGAA